MKEQTDRQQDAADAEKTGCHICDSDILCPSGAAGFCLAVYASKHRDDNESKYAKRIADRSRRCKTDPAAGAEQY